MKVLVTSDIHGNELPLEIAKKYLDKVDTIVFPGDYVDSFDNLWPEQLKVLNKIIQFKIDNPAKVILLWGNHDHAYLSDRYVSGHQNIYHEDIRDFFKSKLGIFDIVYIQDNWIFSHAGISKVWLENNNIKSLEDINVLFQGGKWSIFDHNSFSPSGNCESEGPLWIRPQSLLKSGIEKYNQAVGHTELLEGYERIYQCSELKNNEKIVLTDSPDRTSYIIIDTSNDSIQIFSNENE